MAPPLPPAPSLPADESARLEALRRYQVLDTPPEEAFDALAGLAATLCQTPIAAVSFVDEHRQFFKAAIGLDRREAARDQAICAHVLATAAPLVVADLAADPRFAAAPPADEPDARCCAAAPLFSPDGHVLGMVAVVDREPRPFTAGQVEGLAAVARAVVAELELRRTRTALARQAETQQAVERRIEESRQRLAQALEGADLGFWELDVASQLVRVDERWVANHNVPLDANGQLPWAAWQAMIHPEDREKAREARERHFAGETPNYESEFRVVTPNGTRWAQIRGRVVARDAQGRPLRASGTLLDITSRKLLEAQFLRAQRLESIGTLAGGIAHDLNNVLTPIMMAADLLKVQAQDDPHMLTTVQMIEESAARGAEMVKQVLSFARGYEGARVELQPAHVLRDIGRIVRDTFPRTITIEAAWPRELWTVSADPTQLHQVLLNLCVNARDAMPGGGHLTLQADNVVLDDSAAAQIPDAQPGRYVMLTVGDTGTGIAHADRDRIFEPFYTTKEPGAGTGLGLSTALAIVRSHAGVIDLTSEPERGATFRVYLPALADTGLLAGEPGGVLIPRGHGELVLVVDDEPSIRAICRRTLEAFGYRVLTATDGAEAIAVYAQQRGEVAAVLLDMMMPIMDGPATARALLRMNPQLRIIGGSGLAEESMAPRAAAAGVQCFLPKPYSTEGLLQTVGRMLGYGG